jgi:hypothetical protein
MVNVGLLALQLAVVVGSAVALVLAFKDKDKGDGS